MKLDRPPLLWISSVFVVPALYLFVMFLLALGASVAITYVVPGYQGSGTWLGGFAKAVIALLAFWLIYRYELRRIAGLSNQDKWRCPLLILIPIYLPALMLYGMGFQFPIDPAPILAALADCLLTGFSEEVFFRGFLLSVFIKLFWKKRGGIIFAVLLSSAIFGMMHLANCIEIDVAKGFTIGFESTAQSTVTALMHVVYATFFGVFFGSVLLKSNKLWPVVLMHALVNFPMSLQKMMQTPQIEAEEIGKESGPVEAANLVIDPRPILWTAPLLIFGLLVIRTVKPADIARKLDGAEL